MKSAPTSKKKAEFKRKSAPTERRKKEPAPVVDPYGEEEGDLFADFVKEARAIGSDFVVPVDKNEPMLQVSAYVKLPKPIMDVIGAPGLPCGLITEIFGPPDSGKTTACIEALAEVQRQGGIAILMLTERKFDLPRAEDMGVNVKRLIVYRPRTVEAVREFVHDICITVAKRNSKKPVIILWDSLAATPCEKELNEKRGDFAADQAAAVAVLLRKTQAMIRDHNIAFVMLNQISTKIGATFGKKTQAKGGFAPKFYSALRLEFIQIGRVRLPGGVKGDDFVATKILIEAVKNHLGVPFKTAEAIIDYKGFVVDRKVETRPDAADKEVPVKKKRRVDKEDSDDSEADD